MTKNILSWFRRNGIALLPIVVAFLGVLTSAYYANQANQYASSAAENAKNANILASSAFSIANNYPPSIEVSSTSLELRPVGCGPIGYSGNVSCFFTGTFNVTFTIIGPHQGTYNITFLGLANWGSFYPGPAVLAPYSTPYNASVRIGGITVDAFPPLEYRWNGVWSLPYGLVPVSSSQPFERTEEISVLGFKLTAPLSSMRSLNFQGQAGLSYVLTFADQQQPGRVFHQSFYVHVDLFF